MSELYKVKLKIGDVDIEVESTDKNYVDQKISEYLEKIKGLDSSPSNKSAKKRSKKKSKAISNEDDDTSLDLTEIISKIHDDDRIEIIENKILSSRDRLGKILLCYYFAGMNEDSPYLTTSQVESLTDQLGVKIANSNVAKVIRENAKKYLTGDQVRKQGAKLKYKINRRGIQKFESLITS